MITIAPCIPKRYDSKIRSHFGSSLHVSTSGGFAFGAGLAQGCFLTCSSVRFARDLSSGSFSLWGSAWRATKFPLLSKCCRSMAKLRNLTIWAPTQKQPPELSLFECAAELKNYELVSVFWATMVGLKNRGPRPEMNFEKAPKKPYTPPPFNMHTNSRQ